MDLGLQFEELKCYSCVLDTVTRREETQETIVSDSMPDIGNIITVTGTPYLHQNRAENGMVTSEGEVAANVIYAPEGEGDVCAVSVRIPFRCSVESAAVSSDCRMNVLLCMHSVDVKVLNPRKILVQAEVSVRFLVFSALTQQCSVAAVAQGEVQSKTECVPLRYISHVAEKVFSVEDSAAIAAGHHGAKHLIGCDYVPYCSESKLTGSKVIFKGGVRVCAKYLTDDGTLMREACDLPVSQVVDAGNSSENAIPYVNLSVSDAESTLTEHGTLNIALELYVCAMLVDCREMDLIVDAYSTRCRCECGEQTLQMVDLSDHGEQQHPFRHVLDAELPASEVLMEHVTVAEVLCAMDGQHRCRLKVSCCLRDNNGSIMKLDQNCYIDLPLPPSVGRFAILNVHLLEAACVSTAGGVELRGTLYISYISITTKAVSCLSSLHLSEDDCSNSASRPSAVLRRLLPGETLWDIGKANSATVEEIMLVNQIVDESAAGGRFLLIPRSR